MRVCKYLKQRVRIIGEKNGQSFKVVSKTKKEKKHMKGLSFITQFKIEFLLPPKIFFIWGFVFKKLKILNFSIFAMSQTATFLTCPI